MSERDQARRMQQIESQWCDEGSLPDDSAESLQRLFGTDDGPDQYHRWLLLERLFGAPDVPLPERLQRPSPQELARGAQAVLARLGLASEASAELSPAPAPVVDESNASTMEDLADAGEAGGTAPSLGAPDEVEQEQAGGGVTPAGQGGGLWPRLLPLYIGACSMMALLLIMRQLPQLLPEGAQIAPPQQRGPMGPSLRRRAIPGRRLVKRAPPRRPYAGAKGPVNHDDPAWLRLFFGVSAAHQAQPQRRGRTGLGVLPGEWLYFMFEKSQVAGFLTLLEVKVARGRATLSQLFPAAGKSARVAASRRKWVLSVGKVALRLQVPHGPMRLVYLGLLTPQPLSASGLRRLRQVIARDPGFAWGAGQREALARRLGVAPRRIDGFWIQVRSASPKAPSRRREAFPQPPQQR